MNETISVIIPVYNRASFLHRCLDSICNQTYTDLEIITINDGSTDNSLEILTSFASKDKRIKIISQENMGVTACRNTGIGISTGKYLGFVDSDDYIDINFYEKLYQTLKKANADYVMCMTKRFRDQSETYRILPPYHAITTSSFSEKISLLRGGYVISSIKLVLLKAIIYPSIPDILMKEIFFLFNMHSIVKYFL